MTPYTNDSVSFPKNQLWYYADDQHTMQGPISFNTLSYLHTHNIIHANTFIWSAGMLDWCIFQKVFPAHMLPLIPPTLGEIIFSLSGKMTRTMFWAFYLKITAYLVVIIFLLYLSLQFSFMSSSLIHAIGFLSILAFSWVHFAMSIKRLNDANLSAWFMLLNAIPIIAIFIILSLCLRSSHQYSKKP